MLVATDGATGVGSGDPERRLGITDIERIGRVLFTEYAVAFQLTAALLTIGVIGAVVLTRSLSTADQLDDLEPASMDLLSLRPGANDEHHVDTVEEDIVILAELALTRPTTSCCRP